MDLSPQQRSAVECEAQSICVVAGPGSGKTRVLIERFAWLVERRGIDPGRILAITFTEKAANEMKQRLAKRFAQAPELREKIETAWLSTIDAFCARLLGEHAIEAGLPPDFTVLDPAQAVRLQREAAEEALDQLFAEQPAEMRRLLEALDLSTQDDGRQPDLAQSLIETYETMRLSGTREAPASATRADVSTEARKLALAVSDGATLLTGEGASALLDWVARFVALPLDVSRQHLALAGSMPALTRLSRKSPAYAAASRLKKEFLPQLEGQWIEAWHEGLPDLLRTALLRIDETFRSNKLRQGVVDFTDLEEKTIQLLESDRDLRARIRSRFEHVLMDELQDTNRLQWRLVNLLRTNLFAVGDINQSIYGFRHADRTVFDEYRAQAHVIALTDNYRSRGQILQAVAQLMDVQPGVEPRALEAKREFPSMSDPVVERFTGSGDDAEGDEAAQVAARIRAWIDSKQYQHRDIAILARTLASTAPFEQALDRLNIPFLVSGGRTLLEARESRDLIAFLAALVNPLDEIALVTVCRGPLAGWSDEQIMRASHDGLQKEFDKLFGRIRKLAEFVAPDRLIAMALDECGYAAALNPRAQANIDKLLAWLRREYWAHPRPLAELLEDLEALRASQAEPEAPPPEAADAVRIMTIHAAKGLEFPVVFVAAMHRGPDRRTPVILYARDAAIGIKWRNPVTGKGAPDANHRALSERRKNEESAEENRLLYVAMTRAEDRLILSHAERDRSSAWVKLASRIEPSRTEQGQLVDGPRFAVLEQPLASNGNPRARLVHKPGITGQYDSSASVTSVALFQSCPRKYYLSRYLSLDPEPMSSGTGAIELGLEVHRALAGEAVESTAAIELSQRFHASDLGQRAAQAQRVEREFDFQFAIDDIILRGQIDLWFEEAGELVLVDYKTDRDESGFETYALQLRLYALALKHYTGRIPGRAVLFYPRTGRTLEISLAPADLEEARSAVRSFRSAQDLLEFRMKVGEQCGRCSFWRVQCKGS
jgi:ATP-dependent exoDNAse (exonuclease V) beta subunit